LANDEVAVVVCSQQTILVPEDNSDFGFDTDLVSKFDFDEVSPLVLKGLKVHDTTMQSDVLKIIHGLNAMVWSSTGC
jgi:hypothetical protein